MKFIKPVFLMLAMTLLETQSYADPVTEAVTNFYKKIASHSQFPKQVDMTCAEVKKEFGIAVYDQMLKAAEAKNYLGVSRDVYIAKSVRAMQSGHKLGQGFKPYMSFPVNANPKVNLILQKGFSFGEAINSFFEQANQGGVVLDCNQAGLLASLVVWKERMKLKNKNAEEILNKQRNSLGEVDLETLTSKLWEQLDQASFGDTFYIFGHPDYPKHYPNGNSRGQNTILVDKRKIGNGYEGLYMGYGPFFSEPRSLSEIQDYLAGRYVTNGKLGSKAQALVEIEKIPINAARLRVDE